MKMKIVLSAILSLILCASLVIGGTFALFTNESTQNIAITGGNIEVIATLDKATDVDWIYSPASINNTDPDNPVISGGNMANTTNGTFGSGGTATIEGGSVTVTKMIPGDKLNLTVNIQNKSTVHMQYRTVVKVVDPTNGTPIDTQLAILLNGVAQLSTPWTQVRVGDAIAPIPVSVELPLTATEQEKVKIVVTVEAIQSNVDTQDPSLIAEVHNQAELLAAIQANFKENDNTSAKPIIRLMEDIEISKTSGWERWDDDWTLSQDLTIDGNGYKVIGLNEPFLPILSGNGETLVVKNITFQDATIQRVTVKDVIDADTNDLGTGVVVMSVSNVKINLVFENCKIDNANLTSDSFAGGLIGYINTATMRVTNCEVSNSTLIGNNGGTVGAIAGLSSIPITVDGFVAKDNKIRSIGEGVFEDDVPGDSPVGLAFNAWRIGILFGTLNGTDDVHTLNNIISERNTLFQGVDPNNQTPENTLTPENHSPLYGRKGPTVTILLDGEELDAPAAGGGN